MDPINIFDFDGTLTTETWPKFWVWIKKFGYTGERRNDNLERALAEYRESHTGDPLETFFGFFNDILVENNEVLTYDELMEGGSHIKYNPGVKEFFKRSEARNYIVSGGLREFLERLPVAEDFDGIYGTPVKHRDDRLICGIGEAMTDEKKIVAIREILALNGREGDDCREVYYIGDGMSDVPAMRFVHDNGGKAVFVYQPDKSDDLASQANEIYEKLNEDGVIDYACLADYLEGSELNKILERQG